MLPDLTRSGFDNVHEVISEICACDHSLSREYVGAFFQQWLHNGDVFQVFRLFQFLYNLIGRSDPEMFTEFLCLYRGALKIKEEQYREAKTKAYDSAPNFGPFSGKVYIELTAHNVPDWLAHALVEVFFTPGNQRRIAKPENSVLFLEPALTRTADKGYDEELSILTVQQTVLKGTFLEDDPTIATVREVTTTTTVPHATSTVTSVSTPFDGVVVKWGEEIGNQLILELQTERSFAERLKNLIAISRLPKTEFAHRANIGVSTMYSYFEGRYPVSSVILALATFLGCSSNQLLVLTELEGKKLKAFNPTERGVPEKLVITEELQGSIREVLNTSHESVEERVFALLSLIPGTRMAVRNHLATYMRIAEVTLYRYLKFMRLPASYLGGIAEYFSITEQELCTLNLQSVERTDPEIAGTVEITTDNEADTTMEIPSVNSVGFMEDISPTGEPWDPEVTATIKGIVGDVVPDLATRLKHLQGSLTGKDRLPQGFAEFCGIPYRLMQFYLISTIPSIPYVEQIAKAFHLTLAQVLLNTPYKNVGSLTEHNDTVMAAGDDAPPTLYEWMKATRIASHLTLTELAQVMSNRLRTGIFASTIGAIENSSEGPSRRFMEQWLAHFQKNEEDMFAATGKRLDSLQNF